MKNPNHSNTADILKVHFWSITFLLCVYLIIYPLTMLTHWEIYGPFKWIKEFPNYTTHTRGGIVLLSIVVYCVTYPVTYLLILHDEKN